MENINEIIYNAFWKTIPCGEFGVYKTIVTQDAIRGGHYVIQEKIESAFADYIVELHNLKINANDSTGIIQ